MASIGNRSPFRQLKRFAAYGVRAARVRQPNSGIQQEEERQHGGPIRTVRFPFHVNKEVKRLPRR